MLYSQRQYSVFSEVFFMQPFAFVVLAVTFDQIIAIIGLVTNVLQDLVLPITIVMLVIQTRAMRLQTTALVEQSKEMTEQTRIFNTTIYSATFQSLYDAEAHIGELMMSYPEASRFLMSSKPSNEDSKRDIADTTDALKALDPTLRERVRWLATAMLDFFEHIWTQARNGGLPKETWEAWEDYMTRILSESRLRQLWQAERGYYSSGFRSFVDLKVGTPPETPVMPPLPRANAGVGTGPLAGERRTGTTENAAPQVARVLRAVTEEK